MEQKIIKRSVLSIDGNAWRHAHNPLNVKQYPCGIRSYRDQPFKQLHSINQNWNRYTGK